MNKQQAESLTKGLTAIDRMIRINRETKQVEIHEQTQPGESKIVKRFDLMSKEQAGWREHNMTTLKAIHTETNGGIGRDVDSGVLAGWQALGLTDNSTKTTLEGYAI